MAKERAPGEDEPERPEPVPPPALSSKHRRTPGKIFERPTRGDIPWRDIEGLFLAAGGIVQHGKGSRRRVFLGDRVAVFHEPHPGKEAVKGAVDDIRGFLESAGLRP
jgi:hypothetical protein